MKVLVADNHQLFRQGLIQVLFGINPQGHFEQAGDFEEVEDRLEMGEAFDLILLNAEMPGWPGFEGIQALCQSRPQTPIVILSASDDPTHVKATLEAGAAGFIPKSSSVKVIIGAINLILSGGTYVPPILLRGAVTAPANGFGRSNGDMADSGTATGIPLTQRQRDVLRCMREGKSNKQIAYELGLSEGTVKIHVTGVMRALGVRNRTQAVIVSGHHMV